MAKLTLLQELEGRIVLSDKRDGWRVEEQNGDSALGEHANIPAGSYEARVRATTTRPGEGVGFGQEVYVFESDAGVCAVNTIDAEFAAT